jgi:hypothetical protein
MSVSTKGRRLLALAAAAPLVGAPLLVAGAAPALADSATSYTADLQPVPLNGQTSAGGTLTLTLHGNTATVTEDVHGLAATFNGQPYPHVQHIHGLAQGSCPTSAADADGNGVIDTVEGQPSYGKIQTTLSTSGDTSPAAGTDISIAPSGAAYHYSRTITLSADSLKAIQGGNAVIVVHGLDPATAPKAAGTEKSKLVPSLPLAATAPALCGELTAAQMSAVPSGGAATGGGATAGIEDAGLLGLGGALVIGAAGATVAVRRRNGA